VARSSSTLLSVTFLLFDEMFPHRRKNLRFFFSLYASIVSVSPQSVFPHFLIYDALYPEFFFFLGLMLPNIVTRVPRYHGQGLVLLFPLGDFIRFCFFPDLTTHPFFYPITCRSACQSVPPFSRQNVVFPIFFQFLVVQ